MAGSMWRMNELLKGMTGVLLLCALLLSNEVMCQDATDAPADDSPGSSAGPSGATDAPDAIDATDAPDATGATDAPDAPDAPDATDTPASAAAPDSITVDATAAAGDQTATAVVPVIPLTVVNIPLDGLATLVPRSGGNEGSVAAEVTDNSGVPKTVVPNVKCVGKEDIQESNAVKAVLVTNTCEDTKRIIEENPAVWCSTENCNVEIFQDGNNALVGSSDARLSALSEALQGEHLKSKLGVTKTEVPPSSSGSSVFVGILVTGLLAAIAITVGYFKCQRRGDTTKPADEAYPVDQENQGNTLVSVAPLNPPPETQEKPSVNGESNEAAKTEPPPTNGHSTTKTADTEL
ncbi:uncharacterized protein LOC111235041 [Scomber scombrus]|uniref:Uncharacterized protein LOC111235041 n=2 Tax=Scomber scombrus TaxID=13677 RepID=A0AAV1P003_SCOSC